MINLQNKSVIVMVLVFLGIIGLWIANQFFDKNINVLFFILMLVAILWVVLKLILIYEKGLAIDRQQIIILIVISVILILLLLILSKKLIPDNFLGAIEGIQRFSAL